MKQIATRIKSDFMNYRYAWAAVAVYAIVTHAFWGRFCPLAIMTGLPCPACGMTRAARLLLGGQFAAAGKMHAMIYPVVILAAAAGSGRYISGRALSYLLKYVWLVLVISLLYYVVRMYLYFPYTEPMELYEEAVLIQMIRH